MRQTRILMGMPITVEIAEAHVSPALIDKVFEYFQYVDNKFSVYKRTSEISFINEGKLSLKDYSQDLIKVLELSEVTKRQTGGYFDIKRNGKYDPSGLVKGWAILNAANILKDQAVKNYYVEAGGDIQVHGLNYHDSSWRIGIRNPFNIKGIVKVIYLKNMGIATSGTYFRGQHIYNPKNKYKPAKEIISLTVIGPNVYEADRFATACFAMGKKGILFLENLKGFEGYMIDRNGVATLTSGFKQYEIN